jgi:hypothetical protein
MKQSARTWAMWVGDGDPATQKFDLIGYKEDSAIVYGVVNMPSMTTSTTLLMWINILTRALCL